MSRKGVAVETLCIIRRGFRISFVKTMKQHRTFCKSKTSLGIQSDVSTVVLLHLSSPSSSVIRRISFLSRKQFELSHSDPESFGSGFCQISRLILGNLLPYLARCACDPCCADSVGDLWASVDENNIAQMIIVHH